ncbi:MAG: hypothetical protein J5814_05600 [Bacteroidaceae bacterium]|nr:hypothetical protein [Bacteroidaceae bacterium]
MKTRQKDRQHADNQSSTRFKEDIKEVSFRISSAVRTFAEKISSVRKIPYFYNYECLPLQQLLRHKISSPVQKGVKSRFLQNENRIE